MAEIAQTLSIGGLPSRGGERTFRPMRAAAIPAAKKRSWETPF
jgi:hypothetical protein